jgi:hypothetical protein
MGCSGVRCPTEIFFVCWFSWFNHERLQSLRLHSVRLVNKELERTWKERVVANLIDPGSLKGLRKNEKLGWYRGSEIRSRNAAHSTAIFSLPRLDLQNVVGLVLWAWWVLYPLTYI